MTPAITVNGSTTSATREGGPGTRLEHLAAATARQLLQDAADRMDRPCTRTDATGRVECEVVAAVDGCDLLIPARDGDRIHLDPHSPGPAARFDVDHAPARCCSSGPSRRRRSRQVAAPPRRIT
ncbi:hypothetical protein GCM10010272_31670 [Streptomyces lateritius]|nr:hypothetical protein GCM10010272_31670 [Streptomyces lateritius]